MGSQINSISNGWSECLSDLYLPYQKPNQNIMQYINTEDRPDMTMFDPKTGQNLDADISLAHPLCQDVIN